MTNEQQAIYIRNVVAQLAKALFYAHEHMPPDAEREAVLVYKGKRDVLTRPLDTENWVEEPKGEYVALAYVAELLKQLEDDAKTLVGDRRPS